MRTISDGLKKFLAGAVILLLVILASSAGRGWYVQNEIIKRYHKEITDMLSGHGEHA